MVATTLDPHVVLGVAPTSPPEEIASAYRALVKVVHPDRYHDAPVELRAEAERRMAEINEAYRKLKGRVNRAPLRPSLAEPLACPTSPYSKAKWDLAKRHWDWSAQLLAWVCEHGKEMCAKCGQTPDGVALESGGVRKPCTWRRDAKGGWICVSHRRSSCNDCGASPESGATSSAV